MKKTRITVPVAKMSGNSGQLDWLPRNPRQWTKGDVQRTARSIDEDPDFLEDRPPLVVEHGGRFVAFAGNLRLAAMKEAGVKTTPAVLYEPETEDDRETIKRRAMKDNGSFGSWDFDTLANEWDDLPLADWGIPAWDDQMENVEPIETHEDEFDETKDHIEVRCKKGDIWQLGEHRLMCGDSIDLEQVKTLTGGAEADMVFTDPPYGVSYTDKNEFLNRIGKPLCVVNPIENDSKSPDEMADFWTKAFNVLAACTKEKMVYYITAPQGGDLLLLLQSIANSPLGLKHMLVWNKNNHVLGRCDYNYKHEPIIYGWKKKGTHTFYGQGKFKTSVWDIPNPRRSDLHPTMKPIELVANCILDGSKKGDMVLDIFGGSGTTIIAAEQTGRRCYMMEIDPHYCDVIISRWEKETGEKAQLISGTEKVPQNQK